MARDIAAAADRLRKRYDDACFACGRDNPIGLALDDFELRGDGLIARLRPRPDHRGSPDVLHGGIAATALDEIMVWAVIFATERMAVTGTLDLRFHKPVAPAGEYLLRGWVEDRRGVRVRAAGALSDGTRDLVSGRGLFLLTDDLHHLLT